MRRLWRDQGGVAATEFVLVVPMLLVVLLAVIELCNFTLQNRRAQQAVILAAEFMSRDGDNVLSVSERHVVEDIWMIVNPTAHAATVARGGQWANGYSRALSSVDFQAADDCNQDDCELFAEVQWSFLFADIIDNPVSMDCDAEISEDDNLNGLNIPVGFVGRAPIVVANFTYPYFPLIQGWLFPALEQHVSAVRKTRNGVALQHQTDGYVDQC